jgi:hypothetical protein
MIIDRWGLPPGYPVETLPQDAVDFATYTLGEELVDAVESAHNFGWKPAIEHLPSTKNAETDELMHGVVAFRLDVEGQQIPFMACLR